MAKTYTFKELFLNWQKAKAHLEEVISRYGDTKVSYWRKEISLAEKAEKYWIEQLGGYGRGLIIQATGLIRYNEKYDSFTIYLVNAQAEEIKEYLIARFPNIEKGTIELKEFQTGILNV